MTLLTTEERRWGRLVRTTEDLERIDAMLNDDSVYLAGRVRTSTMHLIAGANKAVPSSTRSICGKTVGNTYRKPSAGEKVCKFCQSGRKATGFTRINQPRDCQGCGRKFADSTEDSTEALCPSCYDMAGRENAHADGYHRDEIDPECPSCQQEVAEGEAAHDQGRHEGKLFSACPKCAASLEGATTPDHLDNQLPAQLPETAREIIVGNAVHNALESTQDMARKLREMANRITLAGQQMVQPEADPVAQAAGVLRELNWLLNDLNGPDLILTAQRLQQAREA
jgi:hypothetical protein